MLEFISEQTAQAIERQGHIEQLRVSLAEKVVLLKEVHHRVKNNMQVITSLLNLGAMEASAGGSQQVLRESMDRIRSMALVHERLYQSDNMASIEFGEYLQSVAAGLARSFRREGITCNVTADKVLLDVDRAIPCGLIANELISNSMKHGFPQRNTGRIDVSLRKPASGTIELAVQDDGVGFPADRPFERMTSMGMTLVKSLTDQIMGSIELTSDHGTRFCITFPEVSAR
jgi:two-component sensor histidine kinase